MLDHNRLSAVATKISEPSLELLIRETDHLPINDTYGVTLLVAQRAAMRAGIVKGYTLGDKARPSAARILELTSEVLGLMRETIDQERGISPGDVPNVDADWETIDSAPEDPMRQVWVYGGMYREPTLREARGQYWRLKRDHAIGSFADEPTHWKPQFVPDPPKIVEKVHGVQNRDKTGTDP